MSSDSSGRKIIAISKLILLVIIVAGIPAFLYLRYGSGIFSKDAAYNVVEYLQQNRRIAGFLLTLTSSASSIRRSSAPPMAMSSFSSFFIA